MIGSQPAVCVIMHPPSQTAWLSRPWLWALMFRTVHPVKLTSHGGLWRVINPVYGVTSPAPLDALDMKAAGDPRGRGIKLPLTCGDRHG
jgi:hypothetical protein